MILSDKGHALLVRNRDGRLVENIASIIVRISMRECERLDELWLRHHLHNCAAARKRSHREFVGELLAFHCCIAEQCIRQQCTGRLESFLHLTSVAVARAALSDPILDRAPFFVSDRSEKRLIRYRSRIQSARSAFERSVADRKNYTLLRNTAYALAQTALGVDRTAANEAALAAQISSRLQWTSRELTG